MPTNQSPDQAIIKIENARLSFPKLFKAHAMKEGDKPMFSAVFILDKLANAAVIQRMKAGIAHIVATDGKGAHPGPNRICLRDGAEKPDLEGYGAGIVFVSARTERRPEVRDRDLTPLTEEDARLYAGCYVNATVRLWWQSHKQYGKRVNAQLRAVQFVRKGEPFGQGAVDPEQDGLGALPPETDEPVDGGRELV